MNVLIIYGHPRQESLSYALGRAYAEGAEAAGAQVRELRLAELCFETDVVRPSPRDQHLEPDVRDAQQLVAAADHLVFVYPTWWGTMPALLKGFLDRILTSGFAFNEVEGGTGYEGLLGGRSAHLITTMDTPRFVYRWIYRGPGHNAMRRATLQFCGVWPVRISTFGPVRYSTKTERRQWLADVREEGRKLEGGILTTWDRFSRKARAWLRALRLQFYPMTWIAYTVGALGAGAFSAAAYWVGYLCLFLLEVATVLTNDYFDIESDRKNEYYSTFSGGSRMLVEQRLTRREVMGGATTALVAMVCAGGMLVAIAPALATHVLIVLAGLSILALGYTLPPLQLSHRGLGELDVAVTHSIGVILAGFAFQGGALADPFPWLVSVPLFFSILPAILLAGLPDYAADKATGKETLVVKVGSRRALVLSMACTATAALTGVAWHLTGLAGSAYSPLIYLALPHAALLLDRLYRYWKTFDEPERIDRLIALALAYILWFGLVPLFALL